MKNQFATAIDRRNLLKRLGATGLALGLPGARLNALSPPPQEMRVLFVFVPGGAPAEHWMPKGCDKSFTLGPVSAPLEPVKQHCVFLDDVQLPNAGHGTTHRALGGAAGEQTVDVKLGRYLQGSASYANLFLACTPGYPSLSNLGEEPAHFESNPLRLYQDLFLNDADLVSSDYPAFAKRFSLDPEDLNENDFDRVSDLSIELSCLTLAMNKTRVVTLELGNALQEFSAPESGVEVGYDQATHGLDSPEAYIQFRTYLTRKVLYMIQLLAATHDRFGFPLLRNTLVVQVADMGDGQSHGEERLPFMLAGGSSFIETGAYLQNTGSIARVMQSVAAAVGAPVDVEPGADLLDIFY